MLPDINIVRSGILAKKYIAQEEMKFLKSAVGKTFKTKKMRKRNQFGELVLEADKSDILNEEREMWANKHDKRLKKKFTSKDVRQLRAWFNALDVDKSGGIGIDELLDPLLSAGIFRNISEVRSMIEMADSDHSGEIGFEEFLDALQKDQLCDIKSVNRLQQITIPSSGGLSSEMRLSQERRKHMMVAVVDGTAKRQIDMENYYNSRHLRRSESNEKRAKKISEAVQIHHHERNEASRYLQSLERVLDTHKRNIAKDDAVSSTVVVHRDGFQGVGVGGGVRGGTIEEDAELDVGYRGGVQGRGASLARLAAVDIQHFGQGTYGMLPKTSSFDEYAKYDSAATLYSPGVEVGEKIIGGDISGRKKSSQTLKKQPPRRLESVGELKGSLSQDALVRVHSDGSSVGSMHSSSSQLLSPLSSASTPSAKHLVRLNSKPLHKISTDRLKRQHSSTESVLKLKRMKNVEDFVPKPKISMVRRYQKTLVLKDTD